MSPARTPRSYRLPALLVAIATPVSNVAAADVPAAASPPGVGTVREMSVVSVSLEVGSTDRETKRVVYAPPPGWYVRSHRVAVAHRTGTASYTVSTVPAGWNWVSDERTTASGKASGAAKVSLPHGLAGGGEVAGSKDAAVSDRQANKSSHHVLVVDVTAKGSGLWQGGGGIDLTVYAEMVYLGR